MEQSELSAYCHPHTHTLLGADAARRAVGTQRLRPGGDGSIATSLAAIYLFYLQKHPFPSPSYHALLHIYNSLYIKNTPAADLPTHHLHTPPESTHRGSQLSCFIYVCIRYLVFMWRRAESIWALQLHQQANAGRAHHL